jgi:hypothetical protein|tara:strand:+ start:120 stop:296 length:177 start_codon:yes stop_codon:yes gene_type:complete
MEASKVELDSHVPRADMDKSKPVDGKPITQNLLRKRAEHNEGMLSTLEEVSILSIKYS